MSIKRNLQEIYEPGEQGELQKRAAFIAMTVSALISIGVSSIAPVLPTLGRVFELDKLGLSLLITAFTLPGLVLLPLVGFVADNYGRRIVMIPSLLGFAISGAACAFASNYETLMVLRAIQGMCAAPFGMLGATILGDFFTGAKLARMVGFNGTVINVALALTPAIGGMLALIHWKTIFILPLIALLPWASALKLPKGTSFKRMPMGAYFKSLFHILYNRKTAMLLLLGFFNLFMIYGPILSSYSTYADGKFMTPPHIIGYILATMSISAAATSSMTGKWLATNTPRKLLFIGQCLYALALFIVPFMPNQWALVVPVMLFGTGNGMCATTVISSIVQQAPKEQRGSLMSVYGLTLAVAMTFAPIFCGIIGSVFGADAIYIAAGIISVVMIAVTAMFKW